MIRDRGCRATNGFALTFFVFSWCRLYLTLSRFNYTSLFLKAQNSSSTHLFFHCLCSTWLPLDYDSSSSLHLKVVLSSLKFNHIHAQMHILLFSACVCFVLFPDHTGKLTCWKKNKSTTFYYENTIDFHFFDVYLQWVGNKLLKFHSRYKSQ